MPRLIRRGFLGTVVVLAAVQLAPEACRAAEPTVVEITTPRGVRQTFLVLMPQRPSAVMVLFAGGHGALSLQKDGKLKWGSGNFLVRSRELFVAQGLGVAVVDAPADRQGGMNAEFRMSDAHASDIAAVAVHLRRMAEVPLWLVGTSMGTFSAARGAMAGGARIEGLVLTSTVTRSRPDWPIAKNHPDGVASMGLSQVTAPTLVMAHRDDGCAITPPQDIAKLKRALTKALRVETAVLTGGLPPRSAACEAASAHGFLGIEAEAVAAIAQFVRRR